MSIGSSASRFVSPPNVNTMDCSVDGTKRHFLGIVICAMACRSASGTGTSGVAFVLAARSSVVSGLSFLSSVLLSIALLSLVFALGFA